MAEFPIQRDGYLAFDALTLKQHIKNALNKGGVFTDQNYEGSYISTMIEIISYTFHVLMFYLNNTSTENMFSEAQIYENMNRIVKMLDYKPSGKQTAILSFNLSVTDNLARGAYVIPRYSYISGRGVPYSFTYDVAFIKKTTGEEQLTDISNQKLFYQGVYREYPLYTAVGNPNEIIFMTPGENVMIDYNNIDVYVKRTATQKWQQWTRTNSLYFENAFAQKYEVRLNEKKYYELKFGNGINGSMLEENDQVAIYYLESRGVDGEVGVGAINNQKLKRFQTVQFDSIIADITQAQRFNFMDQNDFKTLIFSNNTISTYASDEETVEQIRQRAPGIFRSQYRLVTIDDYNTYISTNFAQLIYDVKTVNNWTYVTEYLKYYYDLGLRDPNSISRVLYNQVYFSDACNFNNVYAFVVPKIIDSNAAELTYLSPANKELMLSTMQSVKTLTSEVVLLDPLYIAIDICAALSETASQLDVENTVLKVYKNKNSRRDDNSIVTDIVTIFNDYFSRKNVKLGQTIDISQLNADILEVDGVDSLKTTNTSSNISYDGVSLLMWNPVYPEADRTLIFNNKILPFFMFPYLNSSNNISSKIQVISDDVRVYENIEY